MSQGGNLSIPQHPLVEFEGTSLSSMAVQVVAAVVRLPERKRLLLYLDILAAAGESAAAFKDNFGVSDIIVHVITCFFM